MTKPTIVILGANGAIGQYVIKAILSDTFKKSYNLPIRVVTRDSSKAAATFPDAKGDIKYYTADIATGEGLKAAFDGVDVVANLLGVEVTHNKVADAAAAAKVKLYIPSMFGGDIPISSEYTKLFQVKTDAVDYARSLGLKIVTISGGPFSEWVFNLGPFVGLNFPAAGQLQYYGEFDTKFGTTSLVDIGKTVASVGIKNPADIPEKIVITGEIISPRILRDTYEKITGKKLELVGLPLEEITTPALKIVNEGAKSPLDFLTGLRGLLYSGGMYQTPKDNAFVSKGLFEFTTFDEVGKTVLKN